MILAIIVIFSCSRPEEEGGGRGQGQARDKQQAGNTMMPPKAMEEPGKFEPSPLSGAEPGEQKRAGGEIVTDIVPEDTENLYGTVNWSAANIYAKPDFLSDRIGYFRSGMTILLGERVEPANPKSPKCVHGWYRILDGPGYICGSKGFQISTVLLKLPDQVNPPTTDEVLPYRYGHIMVNLTPLYDKIPTMEEESMVEAWIEEKKKELALEKKLRDQQKLEEERAKLKAALKAAREEEEERLSRKTEEKKEGVEVKEKEPAPAGDADKPAAVDEPGEAGKEQAAAAGAMETLAEVAGETGQEAAKGEEQKEEEEKEEKEAIPFAFVSAVLMRGFYLSLDGEVAERGVKWYRTTRGKYVRYEPVYAVNPSTYHGYQLPPDVTFPVGLVLRKDVFARGWNSTGKHIVKNKDLVFEKFFGFPVHKNVVNNGKLYYQIDEEGQTFILSWSAMVLKKPVQRPEEIPEGTKWIHVDVSDQTLTAYEGDRPVFVTLISSGKENKDPEYTTPRGLYWIIAKNVTATMENLALEDEAYSIEDVPWTMYFYKSYALHGAFWHRSFGNQRSHGCVNLSPADARWVFYWSDPELPLGWHGVFATAKNQGTAVYITD
ncbi:MAG: L,D-transpeptidase family protein [Pseudomonadota bacterium]